MMNKEITATIAAFTSFVTMICVLIVTYYVVALASAIQDADAFLRSLSVEDLASQVASQATAFEEALEEALEEVERSR